MGVGFPVPPLTVTVTESGWPVETLDNAGVTATVGSTVAVNAITPVDEANVLEQPENSANSYLLDAISHNRLWFHQFRERNWLHLNGLLRQSIEQFAA